MNKPKIVVTRRWPEEVEKILSELYDTTLNLDDHPLTVPELQEAMRSADAVLPTVSDRITAEVLSAEPIQARVLGSFGVGFNHIDLDAAAAKNITVTNTPEVLTDCTADLAMTIMLMLARRAGEGERHVRTKAWTGWRPTHMMGTRVSGKVLGLVGMGRIARAVAQRARHGFSMDIIFFDPYPPSRSDIAGLDATQCDSIEEVLSKADFVSLHCPGGDENLHLINQDALSMMKPGAFLINTARGDVVDESALVQALQNGSIAGAGLDVFEAEPRVSEELLSMDNVVLLPHLGSASKETRIAMGMRVIENLKSFFNDEIPGDKVA